MDNQQALGYMLLACRKLGYTKEQMDEMYDAMYQQFDLMAEDQAEEHGLEWYQNL